MVRHTEREDELIQNYSDTCLQEPTGLLAFRFCWQPDHDSRRVPEEQVHLYEIENTHSPNPHEPVRSIGSTSNPAERHNLVSTTPHHPPPSKHPLLATT